MMVRRVLTLGQQRAARIVAPRSDNTYTEAPVTSWFSQSSRRVTEMNMSALATRARLIRSRKTTKLVAITRQHGLMPGSLLIRFGQQSRIGQNDILFMRATRSGRPGSCHRGRRRPQQRHRGQSRRA